MTNSITVLKAGAAQVDITPAMGTQIAGDIGRRRPAELLADPIYAKALVLEAGGRKLCVLSLDLAVVNRHWSQEIRRRISRLLGLPPENVLVHAVQNHAAPPLGHFMVSPECTMIPDDLWWVRGGDDRYNEFAAERIVQAAARANESLQPVKFGATSGFEPRVAENRRYVMRNGKTITHPSPWNVNMKDVLYCEGPIDPEVGVVAFTADSLKAVALLLQYTCHPVHGYPERYISAGWPGAWARGAGELCGAQCVPMVINGCCGNIHHSHHLDKTFVDTPENIGRLLTDDIRPLLKEIRYTGEAVLDSRTSTLKLPIRTLEGGDLESARKLYREHPGPMWSDAEHTAIAWDWVYAVATLDLYEQQQRQPWAEYEVQVLRIGEIAVVALGGEPFVEAQLEIKQQSPVRFTYFAHMSNGFVGYIPTREAFRRGGYETRTANWSMLAPESLEIIAAESVKLLKDVFAA